MGGPRIERPFPQYEILGKGRSVHQWAVPVERMVLLPGYVSSWILYSAATFPVLL